jgi:hypothetical protein
VGTASLKGTIRFAFARKHRVALFARLESLCLKKTVEQTGEISVSLHWANRNHSKVPSWFSELTAAIIIILRYEACIGEIELQSTGCRTLDREPQRLNQFKSSMCESSLLKPTAPFSIPIARMALATIHVTRAIADNFGPFLLALNNSHLPAHRNSFRH